MLQNFKPSKKIKNLIRSNFLYENFLPIEPILEKWRLIKNKWANSNFENDNNSPTFQLPHREFSQPPNSATELREEYLLVIESVNVHSKNNAFYWKLQKT